MNISFVYPSFLFALSLIVVPIIIHLFNFRKFRKVYFTNVQFLTELKQETTSRSKLKHLLVLASRILAVCFLVAAFAQPYLPAAGGQKMASTKIVSIYIDNSFSMDAVTREGTLLEIAMNTAKTVATGYKPSDRFHLLTNDFDPAHQRLITREEFLSLVDGVKISPVSRSTSEIISRQTDILNSVSSGSKSAVIISDFQKSVTDVEALRDDSTIAVSLIPVTASTVSNVAVDSCWFGSPVVQLGQMSELHVRLRNYSDADVPAVPVKLIINKVQKAVAAADVPALAYTDVTLTFTAADTGWQKGMVNILDNPIVFDDDYYFSFHVAQEASLLAVNESGPGPFLGALFNPEGYFQLDNSNVMQLDYGALPGYQLIFINQLQNIASGLTAELSKYVSNGGTIVIIPDSSMDMVAFSKLLSTMGVNPVTSFVVNTERVEKLLLEDPVFDGVFSSKTKITSETDLPVVNGYFLQTGGGQTAPEVLMQLRSGAPFLSRYKKDKGTVYLFSVPFSGTVSNFARHALFVPVIYRIALLSRSHDALAHFIGVNDRIELATVAVTGDNIFHLVNHEKKFDAIPMHRSTGSGTVVSFDNLVTEAGNYELTAGNKVVAMPSFNYNRKESVMSFNDSESLNAMIEQATLKHVQVVEPLKIETAGGFTGLADGYALWKWCVLLTLLFLAIEIILLKFWKK